MTADFRREWIKERVITFLSLPDGSYFDDMLAADDGEIEEKLDMFLDDDVLSPSEAHKKFFYVYKTAYEKLIEEEVLIPHIGENI